jgi:hypothetical protein
MNLPAAFEDIAKISGLILTIAVALATLTTAIYAWVRAILGRNDKRQEQEAAIRRAIDSKAERLELQAIQEKLEGRITESSERNRVENLDTLKQVISLDKTVTALHTRFEEQRKELQANTSATMETQATVTATKDMVGVLLERIDRHLEKEPA